MTRPIMYAKLEISVIIDLCRCDDRDVAGCSGLLYFLSIKGCVYKFICI